MLEDSCGQLDHLPLKQRDAMYKKSHVSVNRLCIYYWNETSPSPICTEHKFRNNDTPY